MNKSIISSQDIGRNAPCSCGSGIKYKKCCLLKEAEARKPQSEDDAVIVCMPTRGQICYETHLALRNNLTEIKHVVAIAGRKPIADARNELAGLALKTIHDNPLPFTPREFFVLWIDDDAWWQAGTVGVMRNAMRDLPLLDVLFGRFGPRHPYSHVLAFRDAADGNSFPKEGIDCKMGEIVPVEAAGFHFVLMRSSALTRIGDNPFSVPEGASFGEDIAFCKRAVAAGIRMGVAMGIPIVHIDSSDGTAYMPGLPAMMMCGDGIRSLTLDHAIPSGAIKTSEQRAYGLSSAAVAEAIAATEAKHLDDVLNQRRALAAV